MLLTDDEVEEGSETKVLMGVELGASGVLYEVDGVVVLVAGEVEEKGVPGDMTAEESEGE